MNHSKLACFVVGMIILTMTSPCASPRRQDPFARSLVRLNITAMDYHAHRPYQPQPSSQRGGQAIAVSDRELICVASQVQNHRFIQVKTAFQNRWIEAEVRVVDYDLNLALLEVNPDDLDQPLVPMTFKTGPRLGSSIQYYWLTTSGRILSTGGSIDYPDVIFYPVTQAGLLYFMITREAARASFSEVVCQKDKAIGLVIQTNAENKISTMLPAEAILDFLKRARKEEYIGVPKAGFTFLPLEDSHTRSFLKLPANESRGIWITEVYDFGTGSKELQTGDVLLQINGFDLDPEGIIEHDDYGKLQFWYLISTNAPGEILPATVFREGKTLDLKLSLETFESADLPVPYHQLDRRPQFFIYGGLVFTTLSLDYLQSFGSAWRGRIDPLLVQDYVGHRFKRFPDREHTVLLSHVLKAPINQGYQDLANTRLVSINGETVTSLAQAFELLRTTGTGGFDVFRFDGFSMDVALPEEQVPAADQAIQTAYGLTTLSRFED